MTNQKGSIIIPLIIALFLAGSVGSYFAFGRQTPAYPISPLTNSIPEVAPLKHDLPDSKPISYTPPKPVNVENARTLYEGSVEIEPVSLSEIKAKLKKKNIYHVEDGESIVIYPHGLGMGPLSFTLTKNTLKATKDIPGTPDLEKYKQEIRQDVKDTGEIVTVKENTWNITKTTYPWTAVY